MQFVRESRKILVLKEGKQTMLGSFDEITKQGFNVDEILKQFSKVTQKASIYKEEMKAQEAIK
jgi:hypothetical protein